MNEAAEVPDIKEVVEAFNKATSCQMTEQHYIDWLEGGELYDDFDEAVEHFIGLDAYEQMNDCARLDAYLRFVLDIGPDNAGGIHFEKLHKIKWTREDLKSFAAARCVDVYNDFTFAEIDGQPKSIRQTWEIGRLLEEA